MKFVTIIAGLLVVVILTAGALLLSGIPGSLATSLLQSRIEQATGGRVTFAAPVKIALSPVAVTASDVTLEGLRDLPRGSRLELARVRAELDAKSLFSGTARVTELTLDAPRLRVPVQRRRNAPVPARPADQAGKLPIAMPDRVSIRDGTVILLDASADFESRITGIELRLTAAADRRIQATAAAQIDGQPLTLDFETTLANGRAGQPLPLSIRLDAPGVLPEPLAATTELRLAGTLLRFNGLSGTIGKARFNGWASVDLATKPQVKLDADFERLALAAPEAASPWSETKFDLRGLNYVDAEVSLSAAELRLSALRMTPVAIKARLDSGILTADFANVGLYDGHGSGAVTLDVSGRTPTLGLRADVEDARALPLLQSLADFDRLDATMRARLALQSQGDSPRAITSNLAGTAFLDFRNGEIRNLNVAQMVRSLMSATLSGWQADSTAATDLSQLSASFQIDKGQATTADLALAGPLVRVTGAGTVDLAARTLAFKMEPRLVLTLQGQGGAADPVGLGVPVTVEGPWAEPRIYPEVAGMLDNPAAAYQQLRALGQGLFGRSNGIGDALGGLLQGFGSSRGAAPPPDASPGNPSPAPAEPRDNATMDAIMDRIFGR